MRKNVLFHLSLLIISFLLCLNTAAQTNEAAPFLLANQKYEAGDYNAAIKQYNLILEFGSTSTDLHYNLANAYFKNSNIPKAIYHYEKSIKLNPSNEDAAYNLNLANEKTVDKIEAIPELFIYRWWKTIFNLFSADNWAKIMLLLLVFSVLSFTAYLFLNVIAQKKTAFYFSVSCFFIVIFTWFMAAQQKKYLNSTTHAIIMAPTVDIVSAPSEGSSQLFVLHEGTKVKLDIKSKEWYQVSLPNGNQGWLKAEALAVY